MQLAWKQYTGARPLPSLFVIAIVATLAVAARFIIYSQNSLEIRSVVLADHQRQNIEYALWEWTIKLANSSSFSDSCMGLGIRLISGRRMQRIAVQGMEIFTRVHCCICPATTVTAAVKQQVKEHAYHAMKLHYYKQHCHFLSPLLSIAEMHRLVKGRNLLWSEEIHAISRLGSPNWIPLESASSSEMNLLLSQMMVQKTRCSMEAWGAPLFCSAVLCWHSNFLWTLKVRKQAMTCAQSPFISSRTCPSH